MGNLSDSFPMRTVIEIRHLGRFGCRRPAEPIFVSGNGTAPAQSENRVVADPPLLKIQQGIAPKAALMVQPTAARLPTQKQLDLNIVYTESTIYDPGASRYDKVRCSSWGAGRGRDATFEFTGVSAWLC